MRWVYILLQARFQVDRCWVQIVSTVLPVVWRLSSDRCAAATSCKAKRWSIRIFTAPVVTLSNKCRAMVWQVSCCPICVKTEGLVIFNDPSGASCARSNGGVFPDELPNVIIIPNGFKQARDLSNVSAPTESITTSTPRPLVSFRTSFGKSSR